MGETCPPPFLVFGNRTPYLMASISNSVPAHAYHGVPATSSRLAGVSGARLAAPSAPYIGRGNKCIANEDTCEGNKVKDQELCAGHLRSYNKALKEAEQAEAAAAEEPAEVTDGI